MGIFQTVKSTVSISKVLTFYGITFKNKKAICPFHKDKHPNLTVSETKQMFKCHACGVGGDGIYFIKKLFGLSSLDAVKKINNDFRLGLDISKPSISQQNEIYARKLEKEKFDIWAKEQEVLLFENYMKYKRLVEENPPFTDTWVEGVNGILKAEYMYDSFCDGTDEDKKKVVKSWK